MPVSRIVRRLAARTGRGAHTFILDEAEPLPGSIEPWQAMAVIRPYTAHMRSLRLINGIGEAFAALTLICAGALFIELSIPL